jgi:uncharacterized membrane protein YhaH (DUF805 family)
MNHYLSSGRERRQPLWVTLLWWLGVVLAVLTLWLAIGLAVAWAWGLL